MSFFALIPPSLLFLAVLIVVCGCRMSPLQVVMIVLSTKSTLGYSFLAVNAIYEADAFVPAKREVAHQIISMLCLGSDCEIRSLVYNEKSERGGKW